MIIKYKKQKGHIPKGRLVDVTNDGGKKEIEEGFAEEASREEYDRQQAKRHARVIEAEINEDIREEYEQITGKKAPKSWDSEKISSELDKMAEEALNKKIDERINKK